MNTQELQNQEPMQHVLTEVDRSKTEVIRIAQREYKGSEFIDIRVFFRSMKSEDLFPTRKGFTLKKEAFDDFAGSVVEARAMINQGI